MEKVYRLGDISKINSDVEKTVYIIKDKGSYKSVTTYIEKNGILSCPRRCEKFFLNEDSIEFLKNIKEKFMLDNELAVYVEKKRGMFRVDESDLIDMKDPIYINNKSGDFGVIFSSKDDLINLFLNLDETEKNLKTNVYVKRP